MEWEKFVWTWGPAAPVIILLGKVLWDLVYKTIPRGFREIRRAMESFEKSATRRHNEHMEAMRVLRDEIHTNRGSSRSRRTPRKGKQ